MEGGMTFRSAIDRNKQKVIAYMETKSMTHTRDICDSYGGEKEMPAVRKALNELRKEGKITTDDKVHFWIGKRWSLTDNEK